MAWYLILAPLLLLPIISLFYFVGCAPGELDKLPTYKVSLYAVFPPEEDIGEEGYDITFTFSPRDGTSADIDVRFPSSPSGGALVRDNGRWRYHHDASLPGGRYDVVCEVTRGDDGSHPYFPAHEDDVPIGDPATEVWYEVTEVNRDNPVIRTVT
jgi:hypothetical protein